mmetsp:Transcript_21950/g.19499  ORF Transcript_21950/g.19499 Transcript_21950/m.19499 type:complete len:556 (+) Transcript_21950:261-1928(+)|eukprot:CAMPEP_0205804010 /NCGR_PEP_ID=MMETSP0205-20121125/6780_1 /ASSEMBLY_ACC=CAM_ASM_000278 /TAXON_ID=36767 /ORGANISM="Euplotes focardii, Strain TN1" /LENGTH=555 /DNA_ID=CAMNT_0053072893 /DNA_START=187 /DNA_END=1854 /DNA_ORIENTATION=+
MAKFSQLFEHLSSQDVMDKISIGLENDNEEGIKHTLLVYNTILSEYCKDGTNKRINISAPPEDDDDLVEQDNDTLGLKLDCLPEAQKDKSQDKSGDQSGSNLSKEESINQKESEKEKQFITNITTVIPLIIQLISDEVNQKYIDTSYADKQKAFGSMKIQAMEMIRIITSKFCPQVKDELIKSKVYNVVLDLFEKYPNNSILHSKIEEIIKFSLNLGGEQLVEEIMYNTGLIKYILSLNSPSTRDFQFPSTSNTVSHGYYSYLLSLSNELISISKNNTEIQNTLDSIPEWTQFQNGSLKQSNDVLEGALGGRDPRERNETPFDENGFLKNFKLVPFESIKNRRKKMAKRQEEEIEQETEEEEDEDEEKLDFDEINKYFTSNDDDEIELELDLQKNDIFSQASEDSRDLKPSEMMSNRYDTIELDEEDDVDSKNLEWNLDPVWKESDDEKIIDDSIREVAMEFIEGQKSRRSHKKNQEAFMNSQRKELDLDDDILFGIKKEPEEIKANVEVEDQNNEDKVIPEEAEVKEDKKYYDTNYWESSYTSNFRLEDLLLEA